MSQKLLRALVDWKAPLKQLKRNRTAVPQLFSSPECVSAGGAVSAAVIDFREYCAPGREKELSDFLYKASHMVANTAQKHARVVALTTSHGTNLQAGMVEGLVRSLSKELAGKGGVVNMINVTNDSKDARVGACDFFASDGAAFVNGQRVDIEQPDRKSLEYYENRAKGKAVVTGAARGIGFETVKELKRLGFDVYGVDHPGGDFTALEKLGVEGVVKVDVTDESSGNVIGDKVGGDVNLMVHAAGITRDKTMKRMKPNLWDDVLSVNLFAIQRIDQQLIESGVYNNGARIIGISSTSGVAGNLGQGNYAASKSGLIGYIEDMNGKHEEFSWNNVAPGFIKTDMTANLPLINEVVTTRVLTPLMTMGEPDDVAGVIGWLGVGGKGVRGQTVRVCGGMLAGR
ncbi:hypothetical protein TrCOL_g7548 [Triparma columacea]|uniref:Uncharacterized protein n=1 Tax=Triparma columacea TaxID=722753 RepID=A0A9W7LF04_9STRA|nr:hypothetical protein TrCOL_g7548 [Triparma columacea]